MKLYEVEVSSFADVGPLLHWAEPSIELRITLPTAWLRMQGAFAYSGGWHPFVAALENGPEALRGFYNAFMPSDLASMYFLEQPCELPPWEIPWIGRLKRTPPPGEAGLSADHGVSFYGPATDEKVAVEYRRLKALSDSVRAKGYDPDAKGGIAGHFLRRGGEYRFFVRGGKHRSAVLAHLGKPLVPVGFRTNWPRVVDLRDAADWPLVRSRAMTKSSAEAVFHRYFDFDGSHQRVLMGKKV